MINQQIERMQRRSLPDTMASRSSALGWDERKRLLGQAINNRVIWFQQARDSAGGQTTQPLRAPMKKEEKKG